MTTAVRTAAILAAGRGTRMGSLTADRPKGLLELHGTTLVQRSCEQLVRAGVERIVIGTGHEEAAYRAFAGAFEGAKVECVYNPLFQSTGSMYTLYNLRHSLDETFLLLESDLLYELRALEVLQETEEEDLVLASGPTFAGDEVYLELDPSGHLRNLSKNRQELDAVDGELVGIGRLSLDTYERACELFAARQGSDPLMDYEQCLMNVSTSAQGLPVLRVDDLVWCEVDDAAQLRRALDVVWPQLECMTEHDHGG